MTCLLLLAVLYGWHKAVMIAGTLSIIGLVVTGGVCIACWATDR